MTGTPAKLTSLADGLCSLHGLLRFIKHPVAHSHAAWRALAARVERAGAEGDGAASERLATLLRECMVRNANMLALVGEGGPAGYQAATGHYTPHHSVITQ